MVVRISSFVGTVLLLIAVFTVALSAAAGRVAAANEKVLLKGKKTQRKAMPEKAIPRGMLMLIAPSPSLQCLPLLPRCLTPLHFLFSVSLLLPVALLLRCHCYHIVFTGIHDWSSFFPYPPAQLCRWSLFQILPLHRPLFQCRV